MKSSTQMVTDTLENESGAIQTKYGTLIPVKLPEDFKERLVSVMSNRLVPDIGGIRESMQRMENYQVNNNNQPVEINVHYDALINVEGNVDEKVAKLLPQQLEQSYKYTTKRIFDDATKIGVRIRR